MNKEAPQLNGLNDYIQNVLGSFVKCKKEYLKNKEEHTRLFESYNQRQIEIQEVRELEKSHRYQLSTSREIICNLQESVSNLVPLKRDIKKLTTELEVKDKTMSAIEEERDKIKKSHLDELQTLTKTFEKKMEQMSLESDLKLAQTTCRVAELCAKIEDLELGHKEKMNLIVLEYEERLQRAASQLTQLRDQHAALAARTDANTEVYRRRIAELEEEKRQGAFNRFLSSSGPSYEPYPPHRPDGDVSGMHPDFQRSAGPPPPPPPPSANRAHARSVNALHVVPIESSNKQEKKRFNTANKRKLYSDKEFV